MKERHDVSERALVPVMHEADVDRSKHRVPLTIFHRCFSYFSLTFATKGAPKKPETR